MFDRSGAVVWIDFDDILVYTYELLKEREDIRKAWQQKFPYILIDEFQDINKIQYEIVKMLAGETKNLFIVGDDDQSIYKFRGARPELMLNFSKDFENTRQVILNRNYRCGEEIVQVAEDIISYNTKRFEKKMQAREDATSMATGEKLETIIWDRRVSQFDGKSFYKEGNVYNYNKRMNATGGNDYWESAVARPDLILSDMIKALHPELLPHYEFTYMQKLK